MTVTKDQKLCDDTTCVANINRTCQGKCNPVLSKELAGEYVMSQFNIRLVHRTKASILAELGVTG